MATRTLQPSEYDIQREVEALRDIRRRSVTPGALTIDPDLPNQSPPPSPTTYRLPSPDESSVDGATTSSNFEDVPPSSSNPADDPFHLFWVPASLHPEIAPAEFRAFLKEHARSPPLSDDNDTLDRSDSKLSGSILARKKSMLSRQYRPAEHDGVENERITPLRRNRSSLYANRGPQLTINDLQRLEQLAEEASASDDPSRLRNVLRRSLSLNISPSAIGQIEDMPEMGDEADAPIIVPPPGQILRRAARTKIRKVGLPGDGEGHRFGSSRRKMPTRTATAPVEHRTSSDMSSSDHGDSVESISADRRSKPFSDDGSVQRPESFSEETSIFDAYAREPEEEEAQPPAIITSSPPSMPVELPDEPKPSTASEIQPALLEALGPVIHHPQPQHLLSPQSTAEQQVPSRTPSPSEASGTSPNRPPLHQAPASPALTPSLPPQRKERDRKGLFGKWGNDRNSKKGKLKEAENKDRLPEKESGFFVSLFGSKKKQDEIPPPLLSVGNSGGDAAQALLGAPKSRGHTSPAPSLSPGTIPNNYARYPIHVERAIYRLSHIKLANPRRPLYEQVLISNLMFWYLGVINKTPTIQQSLNGQVSPDSQVSTGPIETQLLDGPNVDKERKDGEQREVAERVEDERAEGNQLEREREVEMKKKESGRKGSLTKAPPGLPGGGRRAEIPVKGPQYEMQHHMMEQEYGGYNGQLQQGISVSRSASGRNGQPYPRNSPPPQYGSPPKLTAQIGEYNYYTPELSQSQSQQKSPGGISQEQIRQQQSTPSPRSSPSIPSPAQDRSRSPPMRNHDRYSPQNNSVSDSGGDRFPSRSLSATVTPSQPMTNGKLRKGVSAHAVSPSLVPRSLQDHREEEDIPLAMWQQQRRR